MNHPLYNALRVVHLVALVGWLGLSTGAWLLLRRLRGSVERGVLWRAFGKIVDIEHVFLGLLLASGIALLAVVGFPYAKTLWFVIKLAIVMCVIVPIECADIAKTQWLAVDASPERIASYERFLLLAGAPIMLAALAILALAMFKPGV